MQPMNSKLEEFILFETEGEINLEEPIVYTDNVSVKCSGTISKVKIEVTGLKVVLPSTGLTDPNAKISIISEGQQPVLKDAAGEINGFIISSQPQITDGDVENGYTLEFELTKTPSANVKSVEGSISIPVSLVVRHPSNSKTSRTDDEINVFINCTPGGGAVRSPQPSTKAPAKAPAPPTKTPPKR